MIITGSAIEMASSHQNRTAHTVVERLHVWAGPRTSSGADGSPASTFRPRPSTPPAADSGSGTDAIESADLDPVLSLLRTIVEWMTGTTMSVFSTSDLPRLPAPAELPSDPGPAPRAARASAAGFGLEYDRHETRIESETTRFAAQGVVHTADGRDIAFSTHVEMTRSFREDSDFSLRAGDARRKDPLVVNFSAAGTELAAPTFRIDLDADGRPEAVHRLADDSGFLVRDRNGDGRINDGREMFGAASGNGFAELAQLDADGNGWIDAADPAFAQLAVWRGAGTDDESIRNLPASGIGAIAVSQVATPFELRDAGNRSLGAIRASGVYLREDGSAGSVQQIDVTV